jgi:hypothetical protein
MNNQIPTSEYSHNNHSSQETSIKEQNEDIKFKELEEHLPPPNPLPKKDDVRINDPPKISVKYDLKIRKAQNKSLKEHIEETHKSDDAHKANSIRQMQEPNPQTEHAIILELLSTTSLPTLYDIEKRALYVNYAVNSTPTQLSTIEKALNFQNQKIAAMTAI